MNKIYTKQTDMFGEFELETKPNNKLIKQKLVSYYNEGTHIKITTTSRTFQTVTGSEQNHTDVEVSEILPTNLKKVEDIQ